jgi:hypothetical protein
MAKYYLKTKLGVLQEYYSHSEMTPVYGNGQGAGDSPSQWCQQSAMLLDLYGESQEGLTMSDRWGRQVVNIPMAAFADDINLLGNDDGRELSSEELALTAQQSFTEWSELLHATGHFMELEKCACYLLIWSFQEDGYAYTLNPQEHNKKIRVKTPLGITKEVPQLKAEESQKILGVKKNPIGNQHDEIARLKTKKQSTSHANKHTCSVNKGSKTCI